jgi:hypothetical protein
MRRSDNAMGGRVEDDIVNLDDSSGEYSGINDVGNLVRDLLEHDAASDTVIDVVATDSDASRTQAEADVEHLIAYLTDADLLEK